MDKIERFIKVVGGSAGVIAIILALAVCTVIISVMVGVVVYGPERMKPESSSKMFELVTFIVGAVSGYMARNASGGDKPNV